MSATSQEIYTMETCVDGKTGSHCHRSVGDGNRSQLNGFLDEPAFAQLEEQDIVALSSRQSAHEGTMQQHFCGEEGTSIQAEQDVTLERDDGSELEEPVQHRLKRSTEAHSNADPNAEVDLAKRARLMEKLNLPDPPPDPGPLVGAEASEASKELINETVRQSSFKVNVDSALRWGRRSVHASRCMLCLFLQGKLRGHGALVTPRLKLNASSAALPSGCEVGALCASSFGRKCKTLFRVTCDSSSELEIKRLLGASSLTSTDTGQTLLSLECGSEEADSHTTQLSGNRALTGSGIGLARNPAAEAFSTAFPFEAQCEQREVVANRTAEHGKGMSVLFFQDLLVRWGLNGQCRSSEPFGSSVGTCSPTQSLPHSFFASTASTSMAAETSLASPPSWTRTFNLRTRRRPPAFFDFAALKAVTDGQPSQRGSQPASHRSISEACLRAHRRHDLAVACGIAASQCAASGAALCSAIELLKDKKCNFAERSIPVSSGPSFPAENGEYGALLDFLKTSNASVLFDAECSAYRQNPPWDPSGRLSTPGGLAKSFQDAAETVACEAVEALKRFSGCFDAEEEDSPLGSGSESWLQVQRPLTLQMVEAFLRANGRSPRYPPTRAPPQRAHLQLQIIQQQLLQQHYQQKRREQQRLALSRHKGFGSFVDSGSRLEGRVSSKQPS